MPQKAVLWSKSGTDRYGDPLRGSPSEISVRWVVTHRQASDPQGNPITIDAQVSTSQDIVVGSVMWLGELADWYGSGSGGVDDEVMEVVTRNRVPDLKGRVTRYEYGLAKYRDTLPTAG